MRQSFLILVLLLVPAVPLAQAPGSPVGIHAMAYAVGGPAGFTGFFGSSISAIQVAGGAELTVNGHASVGAELGIFANASSAPWLTSANGAWHVLAGNRKFRDHVRPDSRGRGQYWTFRAGVALR